MTSQIQRNPTETLELQLQMLTEIVKDQKEELEIVRAQNEKLFAIGSLIKKFHEKDGQIHVKIDNFNMPFLSMVVFLVKLSLAAIPAYIIMGILTLLVFLLFGGVSGIFSKLIGM